MAGLAEMPSILRLDLAVVELPDAHPAAHRGRTVPVYGYCVLHPGGPILVDTGVGFGNDFIDQLYHPQRKRLVDLLEQYGVDDKEVVAVVNSHLHFRHADEMTDEEASVENVDPDPALQEAAVDSIRRIKALNPDVVHLSHCPAFTPG